MRRHACSGPRTATPRRGILPASSSWPSTPAPARTRSCDSASCRAPWADGVDTEARRAVPARRRARAESKKRARQPCRYPRQLTRPPAALEAQRRPLSWSRWTGSACREPQDGMTHGAGARLASPIATKHDLRHTAVTWAMKNDADKWAACRFLWPEPRHARVACTAITIAIIMRSAVEAMERKAVNSFLCIAQFQPI